MGRIDFNIQQGSPEWTQMRRNYLGASDAPVIMGVSPYRTPYQLWLDKVSGSSQVDNFAMQYGRDHEPIARAMFEKDMQESFSPCVVYHDSLGYLMASLDGMTQCGEHACEIKCANATDHDLAKQFKVPEKYYPQLQAQMACTGHDSMFYVSYHNGEIISFLVERDQYFIDQMLLKMGAFWILVQELEAPALTAKDRRYRDDDDFNTYQLQYAEVLLEIKSLEERKNRLKNALLEYAGEHSVEGNTLSIIKTVSKGRIDYNKVPELIGVDLEPYRMENVISWRINVKNVRNTKN
jgi:putative phage-type endonuclease